MRIINSFLSLLVDIVRNRALLWELTKRDLQTRYLGSYLGILWAFIQPAVNVLILWFVFQVGFKAVPVENFPFILWLITGMFPWFFIADSINSATGSIMENSYLVKKVVFRVSLLPLVKILSALVVHLFFISLLIVIFYLYGYPLTIYSIQVFYYLFASICMLIGISWITASLTIFLKDTGHIVSMLLQFAFWGTPIFWSMKMLPEKFLLLCKLNPIFYITEGYRNCFIYGRWFWQDINLTIYYWSITGIVLIAGMIIFKKLRPHFADVL